MFSATNCCKVTICIGASALILFTFSKRASSDDTLMELPVTPETAPHLSPEEAAQGDSCSLNILDKLIGSEAKSFTSETFGSLSPEDFATSYRLPLETVQKLYANQKITAAFRSQDLFYVALADELSDSGIAVKDVESWFRVLSLQHAEKIDAVAARVFQRIKYLAGEDIPQDDFKRVRALAKQARVSEDAFVSFADSWKTLKSSQPDPKVLEDEIKASIGMLILEKDAASRAALAKQVRDKMPNGIFAFFRGKPASNGAFSQKGPLSDLEKEMLAAGTKASPEGGGELRYNILFTSSDLPKEFVSNSNQILLRKYVDYTAKVLDSQKYYQARAETYNMFMKNIETCLGGISYSDFAYIRTKLISQISIGGDDYFSTINSSYFQEYIRLLKKVGVPPTPAEMKELRTTHFSGLTLEGDKKIRYILNSRFPDRHY